MNTDRHVVSRQPCNPGYPFIAFLFQPKNHYGFVERIQAAYRIMKFSEHLLLVRIIIHDVIQFVKRHSRPAQIWLPQRRDTDIERKAVDSGLHRALAPELRYGFPQIHQHILLEVIKIWSGSWIPETEAVNQGAVQSFHLLIPLSGNRWVRLCQTVRKPGKQSDSST